MKDRIPYKTLKEGFAKKEVIPYEKLLQTSEWDEKRKSILKRDGFICTKCKCKSTRRFTANQIEDMFNLKNHKINWYTIGNGLQLTEKTSDGNYWFFPKVHFIKSTYWEKEYREFQFGDIPYVFIKSTKDYFLQVHHKKYIVGKLPWDYSDSDLQTICNWCHWDLHQKERVNSYEIVDDQMKVINLTPCYRCKGAGWHPEHENIEGGICLRCEGKRYEEYITIKKSPQKTT